MVDDDHGFSFDPKTWSKPEAKPVAPEVPDVNQNTGHNTDSGAPPPPTGNTLPNRNLIALGVSAVVLLAGAGAAMVSHPKAPAAAETPVAARQAALPAGTVTRTMNLTAPSELLSALTAAGIAPEEAQKAATVALASLGPSRGALRLVLKLSGGAPPRLEQADLTWPDSSGATINRTPTGDYTASTIAASMKTVVIVKRGEIDRDSFYTSAVTAGITDSLIPDFAKAFAYDFDFQREINPGDIFEAAFEQDQNAAGQNVGVPRLIYASLTTAAKSKALYFYKPQAGEAGWFDGNGISIIRSFMRTPIDGARITSRFGIRVHPVLGFVKAHKGTDFGAPIGTPIFAAGDATVTWAAMKGPNGNLVILQHDNGWQTYYLHMSAFGDGIVAGARVRQGQTIGYVGTTGRSTGPHLHYEMHINGEAVDAMAQPLESGHSLTGPQLASFNTERDRIDLIRSQAQD